MHPVRVTAILFALFFTCVQARAAEETSERPARAAQCFLEVNGVHYVGGDCLFTPLDKIGSFRIDSAKGLSAQVRLRSSEKPRQPAVPPWPGSPPKLDVPEAADATWSGPQGGDASAMPLGEAYNDKLGCWDADDPQDNTKTNHVCAWDTSQRLYLGPTPVEPRWSLAWGERGGMYARIISSSGLDTEHASVTAEKSRDGAILICRFEHDYSTKCIRDTLEVEYNKLAPLKTTLYANCKTKKYTDFYGRHLQGLDDDILNLDTNDKLSTYAGGTAVASTAFEALCPKAAGTAH